MEDTERDQEVILVRTLLAILFFVHNLDYVCLKQIEELLPEAITAEMMSPTSQSTSGTFL